MRLVPTSPESTSEKQSHVMGLNMNMNEKASRAPTTPPMAAVCVDIFHHTFISAHTICITSAAMSMLPMKCGILYSRMT